MSFGLLLTGLQSRKAQSWRYGFGKPDIGSISQPIMFHMVYLDASTAEHDIPRRLYSPNPWSPGAYANWTVV
ncbi:hypothetical protein MKX01_031873, partial [Papaver californicum]